MSAEHHLNQEYDAIIIGSGFGGSMVAHALVNAGWNVLMLERGNWVERGLHNWAPNATVDLTEHHTSETPYRVIEGGYKKSMGIYASVGGPSVFYGGVSSRFREEDFHLSPEITTDSQAEWPYQYADLESYYTQAERILNVAGDAESDPTEPFRSAPYPQSPNGLSAISQRIGEAASTLGLNPFRLPLAINYSDNGHRSACVACTTCDTFACAVEAKNDLATTVLPDLIKRGLKLLPNTVVTRIHTENSRVSSVECCLRNSHESKRFRARIVILSAGALASPHLLLASRLDRFNPGGRNIGRFLMRHVNAIVFGIFPGRADKENTFHKQLGIHDYYFGHPSVENPQGKLGSMQQVQTPPAGLVKNELPGPLGKLLSPAVGLLTGLLVIAEDQPQFRNHLSINWDNKDKFGLHELLITHRYTSRDLGAIGALKSKAKKILRKAGAFSHYVHNIRTFSHAVGTVRMGTDPETSVLDQFCNFRGIGNLHVVDGSFMPTSAGLNPSLTISANALRVGKHLAENG